MWAITSYYNPARYKRRLANYRTFRANLRVPLVAVELSFDGRFELAKDDADILIQISGGAVLWQKERLLNLATKALPPDVRDIAWLDCDIVFEQADWSRAAQERLVGANIVQLFSELVDFGPDDVQPNAGRALRPTGQGIVSALGAGAAELGAAAETWQSIRAFPTGVAWAARRDVLDRHGLYDALIAGGGDLAMVHAMYGAFDIEAQLHCLDSVRRAHYLGWARPFHRAIGEKIATLPGRVYHLWHGAFANRRNRERHRLLAEFDFDPAADLVIGANGAWQWARPRRDLENFLTNYFLSRNEDE